MMTIAEHQSQQAAAAAELLSLRQLRSLGGTPDPSAALRRLPDEELAGIRAATRTHSLPKLAALARRFAENTGRGF